MDQRKDLFCPSFRETFQFRNNFGQIGAAHQQRLSRERSIVNWDACDRYAWLVIRLRASRAGSGYSLEVIGKSKIVSAGTPKPTGGTPVLPGLTSDVSVSVVPLFSLFHETFSYTGVTGRSLQK